MQHHHQHNNNMNKLTSAAASAYDYVSSPSPSSTLYHDYQQQQQRQQEQDFHQLISEATANNNSSLIVQEEEDPLPTFDEFQGIINDYLANLSPKKRDKALVGHARYCLIQEVLKNPRNTSISTAQFRFWVKKMFQLQPGSYDLVCHDNKPVAMREQIYDILVSAHKEAHHGGRDKTSAIVRNQYSWIPKELVARFVRQCPTCIGRRSGSQTISAYTSKTSSPRVDYTSSATASGAYCYDAVTMAAAAAAAAAAATNINTSTPALLYTPSSKAESDISASPSTDNGYRRPPQNYITASPSPPKRPFFGHNGLFDSGDPYEEERHIKLSNATSSAAGRSLSVAANYQIQHALSDTSTMSFTYRRQQQQQQQECNNNMNYTTYTEQAPSYYNALMSSYHNNNANDTTSAILNQHSSNNSTFLTIKIDQHEATSNSNSILSHNSESSF